MSDLQISIEIVVVGFASLYLTLYLTVWVHELGHVIAGRLAGLRITSAGTGTGGRVAWVRVCGIAFYAASRNPFLGLTFADQDATPRRGRLTAFCLGGIAANATVVGIIAALVCHYPPRAWWLPVWLFGAWNAIVAATSLYPGTFRVGSVTMPTDAALLIQILTGRHRPTLVADAPNWLHVFGGLCRTVGERKVLGKMMLGTARGWAERWNPQRATELLLEAERLLDPLSELDQCHADMTRAWVAVATGNAEEADRASSAAIARMQDPSQEMLRLWAELDSADGRVRLNDQAGAAAVLNRLAGNPGLDQVVYYRRAFDALAFRIGLTEVPPAGPPADTPGHRLWLQTLLADRAAEKGDWAQAEGQLRTAEREIKRLSTGFADPVDRAGLDPLRERIKSQLRQAIVAQGRHPEEADANPGAAAAAVGPRTAASEKWRYAAAVVGLATLMASLILTGFTIHELLEPPRGNMRAIVALGFYVIAGVVIGVPAAITVVVFGIVRWWYPNHPFQYGTRSLTVCAVTFAVAAMFGIGVWLADLAS